MKTYLALSLTTAAVLTSCTPVGAPRINSAEFNDRPAAIATTQNTLSASQRAKIGQKIWQNESGGSHTGLTAWNDGEAFPSLGIGHFIWYPTGQTGPYTESFPQFIAFAKQRGANPPAVALNRGCPWPTRSAFMRDFNGSQLTGLRTWLAGTVSLQTDFIIAKSRASLPKILKAAGSNAPKVQANYNRTATSASGQYALIDYVNFKGEGISPTERYKGQGWGLLQVLEKMSGSATGQAAAVEFSQAAKKVMARRVANSGGKDTRWHAGWQNRCATYARPL